MLVNGKIGQVSGIASKLNATKVDVAAVPKSNAAEVYDLVVMGADVKLWETQIFSYNSLQEAAEIAREDPKMFHQKKNELENRIRTIQVTIINTLTERSRLVMTDRY